MARTLLVLGCLAVVGALVGAVLLVWRGPWWLDGHYLSTEDLRSGSSALVTGFRTSVVQLFAVFGAGIALVFTAFNYRLTRRGQITDRFIKALERLGSEELYVRTGGVLALEQIVQDAPDQATHAAQVLNALLRRHAPRRTRADVPAARDSPHRGAVLLPESPRDLPGKPESDVQYALTALTGPAVRRHADPAQLLDLTELHLAGARLDGAGLAHARLDRADLTGARLGGAVLTHACLEGAVLAGAGLSRADLTGARLDGARLAGARLDGADLTGAQLTAADLTGARLDGAKLADTLLTGATLAGVRLVGADLVGARLINVDLTGADLSGADLTGAHLDWATLTDARLDGADLRSARGLTVRQVVAARPTGGTGLPPRIAEDPRVLARMEGRAED